MTIESATEKIKSVFSDQIVNVEVFGGQTFVNVKRDKIVDILKLLRDEFDFDCLMDLCGLDYLNQGLPERFAVAYNLYSFRHNIRFRVKAFIPESDPSIDSVVGLWMSADWAEREAYDMYGIKFKGHPQLRRILLPEDYGSFPLLKDYPVQGKGERNRFQRYYPNEPRTLDQ